MEQLGEVRYWYQRGGRKIPKLVTFFLLEYRSGSEADHDTEVEEVRWLPLSDANAWWHLALTLFFLYHALLAPPTI